MPTYIARFMDAGAWTSETIEADSPEAALAAAIDYADGPKAPVTDTPFEGLPIEEIFIGDDHDSCLAVWQSPELRLHLAARELLAALELAVERLEIANADGLETEALTKAKAAIAAARGTAA